MKKIITYRVQKIEIPLKREPTKYEKDIILGKIENENMFSLLDLIDFDSENVIEEDYSNDIDIHIPKIKIVEE